MALFAPIVPPKDPSQCAPWLYEAMRRLNSLANNTAQGFGAIERGEVPDGSGDPLPGADLSDYLYLPGRPGGQIVHAVDASPSVTFDSLAVGNPNIRFTVAGVTILDVGPETNGSGTDLAWSGTAGWQVRVGDNTSGIRITNASGRAFLQSGILSLGQVQASSMTLGGMNATVGDRLNTEYQWMAFDNTGVTGSGGTSLSAHTSRVGINVDPFDYRSSSAGAQPDSLHIISRAGGSVAPLILETSSTHFFELRNGSTGSAPTRALGTLQFGITGTNPTELSWYNAGVKTGKERFIAASDWTIEGHGTGFTMLRLRNVSAFADATLTGLLEISDAGSGSDTPSTLTQRRAILSSAGGNVFARLGISATSTIIGPAAAGVLSAPTSSRIITIVDSAGTVLSGFTSAGAHFHISGATNGYVWTSDASGVGSWQAGGGGGGSTFLDNVFRIQDNGTPTNELAFSVGGVTGTRTWTVQDADGTVALLEPAQVWSGVNEFNDGAGLTLIAAGGIRIGDGVFSGGQVDLFGPVLPQTVFFPSLSGTLALITGAQTFSSKTHSTTGNTFRTSTSSSGCAWVDNSTTTKVVRPVLSGLTAFTNNSIVFVGTSVRTWTWPDYNGTHVVVGNTTSAANGILGLSNLTAQTANIGATTLLTASANSSGLFRITVFVKTTTAGTAGDVMKVTIAFNDGAAQTADVLLTSLIVTTPAAAILHDLATNNFASQGVLTVYAAASTAITFTTTLTITGSPQYTIRVRIEPLG